MTINIRKFTENDSKIWDDFCNHCIQATFLHTRLFISYHGGRFIDYSLIIEEENKIVALFPAAVNPSDSSEIISHPGITYGGILHPGNLHGDKMIKVLLLIKKYYELENFSKMVYKVIPYFYHQSASQDDLYALFRLNAKRIRCDLTSTIDLQSNFKMSERRRRGIKKSIKNGIVIAEGNQYLSDLWIVLNENLSRKHDTSPAHKINEIKVLCDRFPKNILCVCALLNEKVIAGILLFISSTAYHSQYTASSELGYETSALDLIFEFCIKIAQQNNKKWFDFGISNENKGLTLNDGLYQFKSEFGGGGIVHEFYELNLIQ